MNISNKKPTRHNSLRLQGYDYSQNGAYFVTIVTHGRLIRLGKIFNGEMILSRAGKIVMSTWYHLPDQFPGIYLDAFVVMPNHIHAILVICQQIQPGQKDVALPEVIRYFKSLSAQHVNRLEGGTGSPFWQRGYHDRIIRNETEWEQISKYINANPLEWQNDAEYHASSS